MRFRNNEASRRARCKRNVEKKALFKEVLELEAINKELILKDIKLDKKLKIWKEKIIKLVGNKKMSKLMFREIQGDLFSAPKTYSLAHCVASDFKMSAGIAIVFRNKFDQIDKLKKQGGKPGSVAVLKDNDRFIYYLISKNDSYKKPTYKNLFLSLNAMKDHMIQNNVKKLAIPRIGCGLDRLQWEKVREQLHKVFDDVDVKIVVYTMNS